MARSGRPLKVASEFEFLNKYIENDDYSGIDSVTSTYGIDCYNFYKRTFLILAVAKGKESMLNYLIGKGADLNFQDKDGLSALHFAVQNNHVGITEILINNGAELNIKDVYGNPPIWTAIFNAKENSSIVKMLLVKDIDIRSKNHYGKSPKDIWFLKYNTDIEDLLKLQLLRCLCQK